MKKLKIRLVLSNFLSNLLLLLAGIWCDFNFSKIWFLKHDFFFVLIFCTFILFLYTILILRDCITMLFSIHVCGFDSFFFIGSRLVIEKCVRSGCYIAFLKKIHLKSRILELCGILFSLVLHIIIVYIIFNIY